MADSNAKIPASLFALPAPLGMIALIVLMGLVALPSRQPTAEPGKSNRSENPAASASENSGAAGDFPPMQVLHEYLSSAADEGVKDAAAALEFSAHATAKQADKDADVSMSVDLHSSSSRQPEKKRIEKLRDQLLPLMRPGKDDALIDFDLKLECLIALVPDPIDSHFQLSFDNMLASIHQGFEAHGFIRDRHSLMWANAKLKRTNKPFGWREEPSAILFRKSIPKSDKDGPSTQADLNQLVLLLLVGETPTTGVQKQALSAALDFAAALELARPEQKRSEQEKPGKVDIRILGPEFSGSASSLRRELCNWWTQTQDPDLKERMADNSANAGPGLNDVSVRVLSGSATADNNADTLSFSVPEKSDPTDSESASKPKLIVDFRATILPDGPASEAVLKYLTNERGIKAKNIAMLAETTSYGSELLSKDETGSPSNHSSVTQDEFAEVRRIRFPMSLSRMRSEYEKTEASKSESQRALGQRPATARRNLNLSSDTVENAIDALPTFSNATPATADLVLEHLFTTIKRDGIQAVGIIATDVRDVMFLAQQIRIHTPDVLLFVVDSEILYTHAEYTPYLEGMLVASTYPLFTRNRTWLSQARSLRDQAFPSSTGHGVFNATLAQLNELGHEERNANWPPVQLLDYAFPFSDQQNGNARPPLWLTMVGDTGFWPLQVVQLDDTKVKGREYVYAQDPGNAKVAPGTLNPLISPPSLFPVAFTSLIVLALSLLFTLRNFATEGQSHLPNWSLRAFRWMSLRKRSPEENLQPQPVESIRFFSAATLLAGLLLLLLSAASPAWMYWLLKWRFELRPQFSFTEVILCVASLLSVAAVTFLLSKVLWWWFRSPERRSHRGLFAAGLVTGGLGFLQLLSWILEANSRVKQAIFIERVGEVASGLSPLLPLSFVIAAIVCWALCLWRREYSCEIYELANPLVSGEGHGGRKGAAGNAAPHTIHLSGISNRFTDLNSRIKDPFFVPTEPMDWVFLILVGLNLCYIVSHWVITAEGRTFDWLFGAGVCVAVVCFVHLYVHLKSVCGLFERLLRRLGQHAMVKSYLRVPQRLRDKLAGQVFSSAPHSGDLEEHVRCFTRLATHSVNPNGQVPNAEEESVAVFVQADSTAIVTWSQRLADQRLDLSHARSVQTDFAELLEFERSQKERVLVAASHLNGRLAELARQYVVPRLEPYWDETTVMGADSLETETKEKPTPDKGIDDNARWCMEAETFVAMQLVFLMRQVFAQIQNLMTFFVVMLLCLVMAVQSYPFVPVRLLQLTCSWIVIWVLTAIFILMVRFNRNEILSHISDSTPNRFTPDRSFVLTMLTYVVIPIVGLVSMQFPAVGRLLFGWLGDVRLLLGI